MRAEPGAGGRRCSGDDGTRGLPHADTAGGWTRAWAGTAIGRGRCEETPDVRVRRLPQGGAVRGSMPLWCLLT